MTSPACPPPEKRWFHSGRPGAGAQRPAARGEEPDDALVSRLLEERRRELESLQEQIGILRRQARGLEGARKAASSLSPVAAAPSGGAAPAFWSPVPMVGFRAWRLTSLGMRGVVQLWPEPRLDAVCLRGRGVPHDAPCRCGIYAVKEAAELRGGIDGMRPGLVYGLVALTGRVVEHERGLRAQRAEVLAVALVRDAVLICRSDPDWIARLFIPGAGRAEVERAGGVRVVAAGLPVCGVEYLEDEARRFRETWT